MDDLAALAIPCPTCGAAKNASCMTPVRTARPPHKDRISLALGEPAVR